ncbi:hypothetical protein PYCCODRAFT_1440503 [Trametes coccinea BRFM310]|uniref:Uncharacterized protein n=1 Tax=Trametes coccinea (strain BRFM310) TaxID=1353009 RepID=A0A1Y2I8M5_TRAC3|nr:hypothetical protein PYCCODRAFT_1441184 [Trametes coccinea BRFM310]OSC97063.1 hypothetical protein PYCCODRAFT_1440503 [Trametes coccinea BRFM310]
MQAIRYVHLVPPGCTLHLLQHDSYDGHAAASHLPVFENPRAMTPAAAYALLSLSLEDERCAVGVYQLLGQDFDIFVEANADSYDQARKKWAECSGEEWTKGVRSLANRPPLQRPLTTITL